MDQRILHKFLMSLVAITTFTSAITLERRDRHIDATEESSHPLHWTNSPRHKNPLSRGANRLTTESGKRISQILIGGHKRLTTERDKDDTLWDDGILMSSAGNGKERKSSSDEDDEKKTLAQQVKEGKYGLIQNELYPEEPKRPGIISYFSNSEVPKDNLKNLGGLDEDEVWLAENHVLVLRGGTFPQHEAENHYSKPQKWPPIDDYEAPKRQVKIPTKPKVPPPFPIQLSDGGPVQLFGSNGKSSDNATMDYEGMTGSKGYLPGEGPFFSFPPSDTLASPDLVKSVNGTRGMVPEKKSKSDPPLGIPGPFFPALPPGAVFVPPPGNMSDYDEDDQSIYYPPPYSFIYPQDNTTAIPPGPLVPGIILPPPPDFFASQEDNKTTPKPKAKRPTTKPIPKARSTYFPPRKTGTKLYKTTTAMTLSPIKVGTLPIRTKVFSKTKGKNTTMHKPFFVEVTTAPTVKTTTQTPVNFEIRPTSINAIDKSTEKNPWRSVVSSKHVPLSRYYASTIPSSVEPVEATPASIKNALTYKQVGRVPSQASYYFYEEATKEPTTVNPYLHYHTTTEASFFKVEMLPPTQERKKHYSIEMLPSRETTKDISVKLVDSIVKDPQIFHYTEARESTPMKYAKENSKEILPHKENIPSRESPRMLSDTAPLYYESISGRSPLTLSSYFTTPKPKSYFRQETTEKANSKVERKPQPIYQYSFEAAGYSKQDKQKQQPEHAFYNEYQDIQTVSDQYDYEGTEPVSEPQIRTGRIPTQRIPSERILPESIPSERIPSQRIPYKIQSFYSTTTSPYTDTTMDPHQAYFTKQEEQLLDDVTKEYFTVFGKKLNSKSQSTTPLYGKVSSVTEKPKYNTYVSSNYDPRQHKTSKVKVHYGDQSQGPFSLKGDTLVNYKHPLPSINPDSEYITVVNPPHVSQEYQVQEIIPVENQVKDYRPQPIRARPSYSPVRNYGSQKIHQNRSPNDFSPIPDPRNGFYPTRSVSLEGDVAINYGNPRPPINPDAEFITPIRNSEADKSSYFAYSLPGDGGHFYFLTPQAIEHRQDDGGYLYAKARTPRLLRRRRGPAKNI
ncbi:uncharacterized protein LOC117172921 [Belonocnema kinseyi]|uniref:uncharacterized protein LOC117172921 n=1 Tax=Belonocnema kinseyi TaxID=2817044 RepID=UPI00143D1FE2|nr:uncharacterized protein LOC117172921 [Belonocnema kinseyi]XP_033217107.1 uncharacterized protein LOC117172921 [Belonocnema kinseyi]XP_033217108.1 uncharacterized protein LOC117172921 [Belonocnema kinseyi]